MPSTQNHHCTVVAIDGRGILIQGASGSGKSSIAMGLMDTGLSRGLDVQFVCDDQAILENSGSSLIARAPGPIKGKIEISGYGIVEIPNLDFIEISLVCALVDNTKLERMPERQTIELHGLELELLQLPVRHEQQAVRIVLAYLQKNGQ